MTEPRKVIVVMPAYNAASTLNRTYDDIPKGNVDSVLLVDDHSSDDTVELARKLPIKVIVHSENRGYGANQKTCYSEALKDDASIVVMLHPDYQYDPKLVPQMLAPIDESRADIVLGSRMLVDRALAGGMPLWKYVANRVLTRLQNLVLGQRLAEYHTGYRAYRREFLESVPFVQYSDGFIFDQEILAHAVRLGFRITEIPIPTKYEPDSSSVGFLGSCVYGFRILWLLVKYLVRLPIEKRGVSEMPPRLGPPELEPNATPEP